MNKPHLKDIALVVFVSCMVRLMFMFVVPDSARSFDVFAFEEIARYLDLGQNPYQTTALLNFPPLWMQVIFLINKVSVHTGIEFFRLLQLLLIAIESAVTVAALLLVHRLSPATNLKRLGMVAFALNPIAILLTCQHSNFDVLVGLWVLLAVICLINESRDSMYWLGACLFLGLGILTKTVPLILIPLLAGGFRRANWFTRFLGAMLLFGPVSLGLSILFVLCPHDVIHKVIFYHSIGGLFGISGFMDLIAWPSWIPGALFGVLLLAWFTFGWRTEFPPAKTVLCAALVLAAIPALGPGYSTQYFSWFMPLLIVTFPLFGARWKWALIAFGAVAAATYLFEYAFFPSYGCSFLYLIDPTATADPQHRQFNNAPGYALNFARLEYGKTAWVNAPLFLAYLGLLAVGIKTMEGCPGEVNPPKEA